VPNPYQAPPAAVPPSEYGPIRDIYDPSFAAGQMGVPVTPDAGDREPAPGRFIGLESRGARRRRTILSGGVTAFVVVLVVGLIAFAVWQTQQGDDDPDDAVLADGTPPLTDVAGDQADDEDDVTVAGDVAAGAPGTTARPTATVEDVAADEPTDEPEAAADEPTGEPADDEDDGPSPTPTPNPGGRSLLNLVPAEGEVPDGMLLTNEVRLDEEEVAATFGDPDEAAVQLEAWGWRGHLQREFARSIDAPAGANATTFIVVSVHRFDSPESTDEALSYFTEAVIAGQGLETFEVEELGDEVIALRGTLDGATVVNVYVRTGPYLVRVVGGSADGDPTEAVVELAEVILINEPD
jgi:hypothetical protein